MRLIVRNCHLKPRLNSAFHKLRRQGYIALQAHKCCSSCAGADLAARLEVASEAELERFAGAVFYHRQDAEHIKCGEMAPTRLHIRYGQVYVGGVPYGKERALIGADVASALKAQGLEVEWNGDPDLTIQVVGLQQVVIDAAEAAVRLGENETFALLPSGASERQQQAAFKQRQHRNRR